MRSDQTATTTTSVVTAHTKHNKKNWLKNDIVLNIGFTESLQRGFLSIFIPLPLVFINHTLLFYAAPVMFYLFVSALTHFCFIRYAWQHWVKHIPTPAICNFATELNIAVDTI